MPVSARERIIGIWSMERVLNPERLYLARKSGWLNGELLKFLNFLVPEGDLLDK